MVSVKATQKGIDPFPFRKELSELDLALKFNKISTSELQKPIDAAPDIFQVSLFA